MLDREAISEAVSVQRKTYRLLKWMEKALEKGFVSTKAAHEYTTVTDAVVQWVGEHYWNLPPDCRPAGLDDEHLHPFANMLSTYLLTSFDFVEHPGPRLESECGCYCPMCSYVARARHLRPKKLLAADKRRARKLKLAYLKQLSLDCGAPVTQSQIEEAADTPDFREAVAMAAYGGQLLRRMEGHVEGPAVLALWRGFAWNATGSPKQGFRLTAEQILDSEQRLVDWMRAAQPPAPDA